jgi:metal-responsive CopG/Arc/MetJ family transcriptional regulator
MMCPLGELVIIMRRARLKKRGRANQPVTAAVKRVVVDFPTSLLNRAERLLAELDTNRSEFIRMAVEKHLELLEKAKLEQALIEGYTGNAAQVRAASEEFVYVDSDIA